MKAKFFTVAISIVLTLTFIPALGVGTFAQDNDRQDNHRTYRQRNRDQNHDRGRMSGNRRRHSRNYYRNYGQYRRTQVGNRRFRNHDRDRHHNRTNRDRGMDRRRDQ